MAQARTYLAFFASICLLIWAGLRIPFGDFQVEKDMILPLVIFAGFLGYAAITATNATGSVLSTHLTGPFGERLNITGANQTAPQSISSRPNNTSPNSTYHYTGQHQKLAETHISRTPPVIKKHVSHIRVLQLAPRRM